MTDFLYGITKSSQLLPTAKLDDQKYEFVFVLDRSGSMVCSQGSSQLSSIELARRACLLFLKYLPVDCYFNIIGFGSKFEVLFPNSVQYNQDNLDKAVQYANGMRGNMGENEIQLPLLHVYASPGIKGYMTQIFVITDGCQEFGTARISQIVDVITRNERRGRVFALGIGDQASKELVTRMAQQGAGTSEFVLGQDKLESKVLTQLKTALRFPLLKAVRILGDYPHRQTIKGLKLIPVIKMAYQYPKKRSSRWT